jgi:hypothetical protein
MYKCVYGSQNANVPNVMLDEVEQAIDDAGIRNLLDPEFLEFLEGDVEVDPFMPSATPTVIILLTFLSHERPMARVPLRLQTSHV